MYSFGNWWWIFLKSKNCFYSFSMNDGEFINYQNVQLLNFLYPFTNTKIMESSWFEVVSYLPTALCLIVRGLNFILNEVNEKVK